MGGIWWEIFGDGFFGFFGFLLGPWDVPSSELWVGMGGNEFFGILLGPQDMPNSEFGHFWILSDFKG